MQLLLAAAGGLVLGLGLLIWGLTERRRRYAAELETKVVRGDLASVAVARDRAIADVGEQLRILAAVRAELVRARESERQIRTDVIALRDRLRRVNDPIAVRQWIDELLTVERLDPAP